MTFDAKQFQYAYYEYDTDPIFQNLLIEMTNRYLESKVNMESKKIRFSSFEIQKIIPYLMEVIPNWNKNFQLLQPGSDRNYIIIRDDINKIESLIDITFYGGNKRNPVSGEITAYGFVSEWIEYVIEMFEEQNKIPILRWYYKSSHGIDDIQVPLIDVPDIVDECYPYLGKDVESYIQEYLNSSESVLLLIGEPGTGKTTFIRYMLSKFKVDSLITYDEDVISSDYFLSNFLTEDVDKQMLVIEDSDVLIKDRESHDNKMMNKLLSISDGIIKATHKKIVFSTNLSSINEVDPALIRPGRCFGIINFRALNRVESEAVAMKFGIDFEAEKSEYTLSEIFNHKDKLVQRRKIGF